MNTYLRCTGCNSASDNNQSPFVQLSEGRYFCFKCRWIAHRDDEMKGVVYWAKTYAKLEELKRETRKTAERLKHKSAKRRKRTQEKEDRTS